MKKIISLMMVTILASMFIIGCGTSAEQEETLDYINGKELKEMTSVENEILKEYGSVSGDNYTDDTTMYNKIKTTIIPAVNDLNEKATKIASKIDDEKLLKVHQKYVDYTSKLQSFFSQTLKAIDEQDYEKIAEANNTLNDANAAAIEYRNALKKLAKEYDIKLEMEDMKMSSDY